MGILAWSKGGASSIWTRRTSRPRSAPTEAIATEEQVSDGVGLDDAGYAALRELATSRRRQKPHSNWTPRWLGACAISRATSCAIRALAKIAGSPHGHRRLTLGIGLNGTVFTMLKGLVLALIAGVESAATLRVLYRQTDAGRIIRISYPDYQRIRDNDRTFTGLMASGYFDLNVGRARPGARARLSRATTSAPAFVRSWVARCFPRRTRPGRHPVVVLSDGMWRRDFGADPGIVGKTLDVNNYP